MILTIGAFDGFHRGHALLLERAGALAASRRTDWGVVTFEPHPGVFLGKPGATLFTSGERELIRRVLKIPRLFVLRFDRELQELSPETFWRRLKATFNVEGVVMGRDFRFGRDAAGTAESLRAMCQADGLPAEILDLASRGGVRCSSTEVRRSLLAGDAAHAAEILGFPWFFRGPVVHGDQRGRTMNFPTANVDLSAVGTRPGDGVYAAAVLVQGEWRCGALSVGSNPTFADAAPGGPQAESASRVEVFLLDFQGELYGQDILVFLLKQLRPMIRFAGAAELSEQIARDVLRCRDIFRGEMEARWAIFDAFRTCLADMEALGGFTPNIRRLAEC